MKTRGFTWRKACKVFVHHAAEAIGDLYRCCPALFVCVVDAIREDAKRTDRLQAKTREAFYPEIERVNTADRKAREVN